MRRLSQIVRLGAKESGVPAVAELARAVVEEGIAAGASDIHIEPGASFVKVRYRIGGTLIELYEAFNKEIHSVLISRLKVLASMDSGDRLRPADGHISYECQGRLIDLRLASMPSVHGEIMTVRILDPSKFLTKIEELSFSPTNEETFRRLIRLSAGLFIAAGPMNSGKSTALYAALRSMDATRRVIVTLEDPVECLLEGVSQIGVNPKANLSFEQGLRAILRMDADTLMVGEIRDEATARLAVRAALTGHLLLTTVHAKDSLTAMLRLKEMGVSSYFLAATLSGVLAQRLVRRLCPSCVERYAPEADSAEAKLLAEYGLKDSFLYRSHGCENCHGTGFNGRVAVQEILTVDEDLRQLILSDTPLSKLREIMRQKGFVDMRRDGIIKAAQGLTAVAEVRRVLDA